MRIHQVLLSFLIHLCFINLSVNINIVTSQCLGHQQFLLLHLKDNLVFNLTTSKKLVHWNQSGDCCQWNGVTCNKGQVIGLDLSEENIFAGDLNSSSLFNLQYLQNLNLAYNNFSSPIPSSFQKLNNLRHLNLSNAGFEEQIPVEISQLTMLSTLDLSSSFSSQNTLILEKPDISILLQNLTEITKLYLDGVRVSAGGKQWCHALSSSLKNLQVLSMTSCNLSGPIDFSLSKLQSLSEIRLNLNNISSPVPKFFANFTNLTVLQLSSCGLIGVFPEKIFQVQKLKILDISDNQDLQGSFPNFIQEGYLHTLNLSYTNLSGQLSGSISNLKHLSTLDLSSCQFDGTLPTSMSRLTQLVHLDLSFNYFNGPLPCFNMSRNLEYLSLSNNNLSGVVSSTRWEGLVKLRSINLDDNFLTGRVPSSLFTLPSLQELTLSTNSFFGLLDNFPKASSSSLQVIDLSNNKLQGPIPVSLFDLSRLEFLQLSSNQFNGTLQLDLLRKLQYLNTIGLSHNNLNVDATFNDDDGLPPFPNMFIIMLSACNLREFPSFLRNQSRLTTLHLSDNQIQGVVPNWIWRFDSMLLLNLSNNFLTDLEGPFNNLSSNLFSVDLHSNQLQGMAPIFMEYIIYMDYSNNSFSLLPPSIGKHIYFLSLAHNSFHGKIHESFCNPYSLSILDLSYNNFIGSIDDCLKNRSSNLEVLSLAGNNLIGRVPDAFAGSCKLRFLDLNGNHLVGVIPKSLSNCQSLEVLNLGNNLLKDRFPCFLKDIPSLRVLILRSNKLHGPIGCTQTTSNWSLLHIVDLASNNFNGKIPGTLLKSWTAMAGEVEHKKSGNLVVYTNYLHHYTRFKDSQLFLERVLFEVLAKIVAPEPSYVSDRTFTYLVQTETLNSGFYMDSVTIVSKGLQMKLVKILSVFTYLDLSSNHFEGSIPQEIMSLREMNVLNLSHNSLSNHIPSSLGNLTQLESFDLSYNNLSGEIPIGITGLSFLSVLNLSFNHLVGEIPIGTQIQSFESYSFEGNEGLCGAPLAKKCGVQVQGSPPPTTSTTHGSIIEWNFLSVELGLTFGLGIVFFPLLFWKRWRLWYNKHVDDLLYKMIPHLDFVYEQNGEHRYRILRWRPI